MAPVDIFDSDLKKLERGNGGDSGARHRQKE